MRQPTVKSGPHRTRQRCSGPVCDRPSASRSVPSRQNRLQPPGDGTLTGRHGPGRARTVVNRTGAALTGAERTGLSRPSADGQFLPFVRRASQRRACHFRCRWKPCLHGHLLGGDTQTRVSRYVDIGPYVVWRDRPGAPAFVNSSLSLSDVPQSWKHSLVHPIYKTGDPSNPSNFRPISIIPVVSKIVERAVHQQLYDYLAENHLLSSTQHGFRPRHSTETALISIFDHILSANDRGEISLLCLLDLSKCFDVIDHAKLLTKLELYGIDTTWFSAYLRSHTQSASLTDARGNRKISDPLPNSIGVFQGSALGPLLYCVFANDTSLFAEDAVVVQYADDTQMLVSGKKADFKNVIHRMERALSSLDIWFRANGLKVNAGKTQLMLFGSAQNLRNAPDFTVKFRDHTLSPVRKLLISALPSIALWTGTHM